MNRRFASLEGVLIVAIALHSYGVGLILVLAPGLALRFAGWTSLGPRFFPVQAGIFHLVLATGYLLEYRRYHGISLLLVAKTTAFVFLMVATLRGGVPWAVPVSGLADGLMGLAAALAHRGQNSPLKSS